MEKNLLAIKNQCLNCQKCQLAKTRNNIVFGAGSEKAKIFFIGEAPGKDEDLAGKPFVGRSGKFLDEMLTEINLKREDVFIANVLKCRPPKNRDPLPEEIKICLPFLKQQIVTISPKVIVTLGRFSMNLFFPNAKISAIHGIPKKFNNYTVVPFFHPAAALFDGSKREILKKDFQILRKFL